LRKLGTPMKPFHGTLLLLRSAIHRGL